MKKGDEAKPLFKHTGKLLYKCRSCGHMDDSTGVPNVLLALTDITNGRELPEEWGSNRTLTDLHACEDGTWGVTDLIGGVQHRAT